MGWFNHGIFGALGSSAGATGTHGSNSQTQGNNSNQLATTGQNQGQTTGLAAWLPHGQLNSYHGQVNAVYNGIQQTPFFGVNRTPQDVQAEREAARALLIKKWLVVDPGDRESYLLMCRMDTITQVLFGGPTNGLITPSIIDDLTQAHLTAVLEQTIFEPGIT